MCRSSTILRRGPTATTAATMIARLAAVASAAIVLTGCFTSGADFADDAEAYIVEGDVVRQAFVDSGDFADPATTFVEATCEDPDNHDVGTVFTCTASDSAGGTWAFDVEITGDDRYQVTVSR